jgi:hypothetical protein
MATSSRRVRRRRQDLPNWRVVRYADDFVVLVHGSRDDVNHLRKDVADVLRPLGLRLSTAKTQVVHMSDGFDFLGFRVQWRRKYGSNKWHVYTFAQPLQLAPHGAPRRGGHPGQPVGQQHPVPGTAQRRLNHWAMQPWLHASGPVWSSRALVSRSLSHRADLAGMVSLVRKQVVNDGRPRASTTTPAWAATVVEAQPDPQPTRLDVQVPPAVASGLNTNTRGNCSSQLAKSAHRRERYQRQKRMSADRGGTAAGT